MKCLIFLKRSLVFPFLLFSYMYLHWSLRNALKKIFLYICVSFAVLHTGLSLKGVMIWENGIETCIVSYKKWITNLGLMQGAGCLGLVHCHDSEGWCGEKAGGGFGIGNMCTPMGDSCWCVAKPIQYYKVKNNKKLKKQAKINYKFKSEQNPNWINSSKSTPI